jgi:hypothetical protein
MRAWTSICSHYLHYAETKADLSLIPLAKQTQHKCGQIWYGHETSVIMLPERSRPNCPGTFQCFGHSNSSQAVVIFLALDVLGRNLFVPAPQTRAADSREGEQNAVPLSVRLRVLPHRNRRTRGQCSSPRSTSSPGTCSLCRQSNGYNQSCRHPGRDYLPELL